MSLYPCLRGLVISAPFCLHSESLVLSDVPRAPFRVRFSRRLFYFIFTMSTVSRLGLCLSSRDESAWLQIKYLRSTHQPRHGHDPRCSQVALKLGFRSFSNTVLYTLRRRVLRVYILSSPLPQNHRPQIARQAPPAIQCNSRSRRRSRAKFHLYSSPPR